jgi:hypothetical protein
MKREYWFALWIVIIIVTTALVLHQPLPHDDHWSMVYEAVQTPEQPGGQKRFVLFNEDGLTRQECTDLFDEYLRRLNNNAAVIEYEIGCGHLMTKGHGYLFQYQNQWLIGP